MKKCKREDICWIKNEWEKKKHFFTSFFFYSGFHFFVLCLSFCISTHNPFSPSIHHHFTDHRESTKKNDKNSLSKSQHFYNMLMGGRNESFCTKFDALMELEGIFGFSHFATHSQFYFFSSLFLYRPATSKD